MSPFGPLRGWHLIVVGALLLLTPLVVPAVPAGGYTHHYTVGYVETTDDGYEYSGEYIFMTLDDDILCWSSHSRVCQLERTLLYGPISVDHGIQQYERFSDYDFVYDNGTFYERENTGKVLRLRAVNTSSALERASKSSDPLPDPVRTALRNGETTVATKATLPTNQLIAVGEGRYAIVEDRYRSKRILDHVFSTGRPALSTIGFLLGLGLVLRGQRWRVRG